ncbi:TrmB family transcriptional regulator [Candidatus Woesearchaeota archaeon]|nr:TrmB family transcriptional regulator [Candidatus Woesearchaeota archaeon]
MLKKEIISKLSIFDLNNYEAKLWLALLSRGVSTAGELSDISNVPRSRTYDVLESLEKKGFIVLKLGKPIKYIATHPQEVVERIKRQVFINAEQQSKLLENVKDSDLLKELDSLYTNGVSTVDQHDLTGAIKGRTNITSKLANAIKNAKHSVNIITTEEGFLRKVSMLKSAFNQAKKNGAEVRIAAPLSKESTKIAESISNHANVKNIKDLQARFCIIDGKEAILMPMDDKEVHPDYDYAVWMSSPFFGNAMNKLFEHAWKSVKE